MPGKVLVRQFDFLATKYNSLVLYAMSEGKIPRDAWDINIENDPGNLVWTIHYKSKEEGDVFSEFDLR